MPGWILVGATILGGLAAVHYFWQVLRPSVPRPPQALSTASLAPTLGQAVDEPHLENAFPAEPSTVLFGWRMAKAFPGVHGLVIVEGKEAVDRLEILLAPPLQGQNEAGQPRRPFWWFRGGFSSDIRSFTRLSATMCLLNDIELPVTCIAAWRDIDERREFLYVEIAPSEPTGLYPDRTTDDGSRPAYEEYGIMGDHLITQGELAGGYALVEGKPVATREAEQRMRYVSPYNLIIAAKSSPINSMEFDRRSGPILERVLKGEQDILDLVEAARDLRFHRMDEMDEEVW